MGIIQETKREINEAISFGRNVMVFIGCVAILAMVDQVYPILPRAGDGVALAASIEPAPGKLDGIIQKAAQKYNVNELLIRAIIEQENGNDGRSCRSRYEPSWYNRIKPLKGETSDERRLRASSWGPMQVVYAAHAERCGLDEFTDLCKPEIGIDCGAHALRDCLDRQKGTDKYEKVRGALVCYNGGSAYPDAIFKRLARLSMDRIQS